MNTTPMIRVIFETRFCSTELFAFIDVEMNVEMHLTSVQYYLTLH